MTKISPIKTFLYANKTITKIKKASIVPRFLTGIALATAPFALYNCSKFEIQKPQIETAESVNTNLTYILDHLGLIKDPNKLEDIVNIGFSDEEGNRNYIKFKNISEEKIEAEYLKLNADRNPIESAQLAIKKYGKDITMIIQKENVDIETQLYKLQNREVLQYVQRDDILVPNSKFQKNDTGFIQIFNNNEIKRFINIQNNEFIIIFDDSMDIIVDEVSLEL